MIKNIFNAHLLFFYPLCIISFWMMPFQTKQNLISFLILIIALIAFAVNAKHHQSVKVNILVIIVTTLFIFFCFGYGQVTLLLSSAQDNKITQAYNLFIKKQATVLPVYFIVFLTSTIILTIANSILTKLVSD